MSEMISQTITPIILITTKKNLNERKSYIFKYLIGKILN